jgi:hypothetical protein
MLGFGARRFAVCSFCSFLSCGSSAPAPAEDAAMTEKLLSLDDCLALLPSGVCMSRRFLSKHIRSGGPGTFFAHRGQLIITARQWTFHLERLPSCPSNSRNGKKAASGTSRVPSADSVSARVQAQLLGLMQKPN